MIELYDSIRETFGNFDFGGINWALLWKERFNLLTGAGMTLLITSGSVIMGVFIGFWIALMRLSRRAWLRLPSILYIEAFRNTPMLVQILLVYFGIFPKLGIGDWLRESSYSFLHDSEPFVAGIIALGLNSGAYLGVIFRGGIQSIDKGQSEAALSLGMRQYQVMSYVVLPQALANALPAIGNEFITLIKDSSLLAYIAVAELTYRGGLVASRSYEFFTMYIGIGIIYFVMCFSTARVLGWMERRLRVGHK